MLSSQLTQANSSITQAESAVQQLASGQPIELHDVMISLEKARISVQTIIQVRNRVLDVYQDLMRMQL
jgi:flagellar hook-basal body complex protein FliE